MRALTLTIAMVLASIASAENTGVIQALSGDPLNFSDTSTNIPQVNSSIIGGEYQGSNGVVYLINGVLLPPQKTTETQSDRTP